MENVLCVLYLLHEEIRPGEVKKEKSFVAQSIRKVSKTAKNDKNRETMRNAHGTRFFYNSIIGWK